MKNLKQVYFISVNPVSAPFLIFSGADRRQPDVKHYNISLIQWLWLFTIISERQNKLQLKFNGTTNWKLTCLKCISTPSVRPFLNVYHDDTTWWSIPPSVAEREWSIDITVCLSRRSPGDPRFGLYFFGYIHAFNIGSDFIATSP